MTRPDMDEWEFGAELINALEGLATMDDQPVDDLMLEGLRRRLGLVDTPHQIDRFVLLHELGTGGMGVVYAAYDPLLDRKVALKLLRRSSTADREHGLREARALAQLSHPNVISVYETGIYEDQLFVAMELIEGQTLHQWLQQQRSWRAIASVMLDAGRGLAAAHAAGIVHRDFKPTNVLIGKRVCVADFGLAVAESIDSSPSGVDRTGVGSDDASPEGEEPVTPPHGPGTVAYMAPEQLRGEPADARTDQFALCLVFYVALAGQHPFGGTHVPERLTAIAEGPPADGLAGVPRWVRRLVLRGLHPEPQRRHPDLSTLLDQLERRLRGRGHVGLLVASLATATTVAVLMNQVDRDATCRQSAQILDEVWSPARRDELQAAFEAVDTPYGDHALRFVQSSLDRYASRWIDARIAACHAEERGEAPKLQLQCLRQRRMEMSALLDQFVSADAALIKRASRAVSSLSPVDHCDRPYLTTDLSLLDAEPRERLVRAKDELSRSWALDQVGRYPQALEVVESLMPELQQIGHEGVLSTAFLLRGRLKVRNGDYETSYDDLQEAIRRGLAGHRDRNVALAAASLTYQLTFQEQFERAHEAAYLALAMHRRLTGESTWPLLSNLHGALLHKEDRFAEADQMLAQGIAACSIDDPTDWPDLASMLTNRAFALIKLGRIDDAERQLQHAVTISEQLIGTEHPQFAIMMMGLASVENLRGDNEAALDIQERSLEIWQRAVPKPSAAVVSMLYNIGVYQLELGHLDEAMDAMTRSLGLTVEILPDGHIRHAHSLVGVGMVKMAMNDPQGAMEVHEQAMDLLAADIDERSPRAGHVLLHAARAALALGDEERAEQWTEWGLEIYARAPNPSMEGEFRFQKAHNLAQAGDEFGATEQGRRALELLRGRNLGEEREVERWLSAQGSGTESDVSARPLDREGTVELER